VSNLVRIRSKMAELWPFNWFQNGGRRHLEFTKLLPVSIFIIWSSLDSGWGCSYKILYVYVIIRLTYLASSKIWKNTKWRPGRRHLELLFSNLGPPTICHEILTQTSGHEGDFVAHEFSWTDLHKNWQGCRGPWRYHSVQFWFQNFERFQIYRGSKFPFPVLTLLVIVTTVLTLPRSLWLL